MKKGAKLPPFFSDSIMNGYFNRVPYSETYFNYLAPSHLKWVTEACGRVRARETTDYFELGFGRGESLSVHSVCLTGGAYGNDFMPEHVQTAEERRNCIADGKFTVTDHSFDELTEQWAGKKFDVIVAHGILTWVSLDLVREIIWFAKKHLNDGGIFYISYNALPGWDGFVTIRTLFRQISVELEHRLNSVSYDVYMSEVMAKLDEVMTSELFADNRLIDLWRKAWKGLKEKDKDYLAHEYLNQDFNLFTFEQITALMEGSKFQFVCDANPLVELKKAKAKMLSPIADTETFCDIYLNRQFRSDIWVKGGIKLTDTEVLAGLLDRRYVRLARWSAFESFVQDKLRLSGEFKKLFLKIMSSENSITGKELQDLLTRENKEKDYFVVQTILVGEAMLAPEQPNYERYLERAREYNASDNRYIQAENPNAFAHLISPKIGQGVKVKNFELAVIQGILREPLKQSKDDSLEQIRSYLKKFSGAQEKDLKSIIDRLYGDLIPLLQAHQIL